MTPENYRVRTKAKGRALAGLAAYIFGFVYFLISSEIGVSILAYPIEALPRGGLLFLLPGISLVLIGMALTVYEIVQVTTANPQQSVRKER
jgi:hypothetical protein